MHYLVLWHSQFHREIHSGIAVVLSIERHRHWVNSKYVSMYNIITSYLTIQGLLAHVLFVQYAGMKAE